MTSHQAIIRIICCALSLIILIGARQSIQTHSCLSRRGAAQLGKAIMSRVPPDAVIATGSNDPFSTLLYQKSCEQSRPDVLLVSRNWWNFPSYSARLSPACNQEPLNQGKETPQSLPQWLQICWRAGRPFYWEGYDRLQYPDVILNPEGILFRLVGESHLHMTRSFQQAHIEDSFLKSLSDSADCIGKRVLSNVWFNYSLWARENGDTEGSEKYLSLALKSNQNNTRALNNLVALLATSGRMPAAERLARDGLQRSPASSDLHANLALILLHSNKTSEAALHSRKSAECAPFDPDRWVMAGKIFLSLGEIKDSEECLKMAISQNPHHEEAVETLAIVYMQTHRINEARELLVSFLKKDPNNTTIGNLHAVISP